MTYQHIKSYRKRRLAKAHAYLGGACVRCGTTTGLQFDHVDPRTKVIAIANAIAHAWSWDRLVIELDKCQLLCEPHHLEKSKAEGSLAKTPWNKGQHHGTFHGAYHIKCTCPTCKQFKAERNAARQQAPR